MDIVESARASVQAGFTEALAWAESPKKRSFWEFERELWSLLLALGRALVSLFLAHQALRYRQRRQEYRFQGQRYRLSEVPRESDLGTRFGRVRFRRPIGRLVDNPRAAADLPVDRALGLCKGFSLGVVAGMVKLCACMAYRLAAETWKDTHEWAPSPRAVMRMVDALGDEAKPFLDQADLPEDDGEVLVIQVDGKGAPMISSREHSRRRQPKRKKADDTTDRATRRARRKAGTRPRRTKGKKSKNAKVAFVGVIYTLRRTPNGLEGPIGKRMIATFESHDALFAWLKREAIRRGYAVKETFFLADGSDHLWERQREFFPDAEVCEDWIHVIEKMWGAGSCFLAEGSEELHDWVSRQANRLRNGHIGALKRELRERLDAIPRTGPGNKGKRKRLQRILSHIEKAEYRLNYQSFRKRDLDIGTGAVEGAVRNLVGMRLDGPGMRWSRKRSERLLHLRCVLLNGQWPEFERWLSRKQQVLLPARPTRTQPHDAKRVG